MEKITEIIDQPAVEQIDMMNEKLLLAICRQKELNRLANKSNPNIKYIAWFAFVQVLTIILAYHLHL